jgi:hypothetical protein
MDELQQMARISSHYIFLVSGFVTSPEYPISHVAVVEDVNQAVTMTSKEIPGFQLISASSLYQLEQVAASIRKTVSDNGLAIDG